MHALCERDGDRAATHWLFIESISPMDVQFDAVEHCNQYRQAMPDACR